MMQEILEKRGKNQETELEKRGKLSYNQKENREKELSDDMKKYYPAWYKKFPDCSRGVSYLQNYNQMRWDISGEKVMTDPDGYRKMTAEKILKDLFEE